MTLKEQIDRFCVRVAEEIKALKNSVPQAPHGLPTQQFGRVVFDMDLILNKRVDADWRGLVNGKVANSSYYVLRFPKPFVSVPVVLLSQERPTPSWRYIEIRETTTEYVVISTNYWGSDLTIHWHAISS